MNRSPRSTLGLAIGFFSLACGAALVLSPRRVGQLFALPKSDWLARALGARDVAIGVALLARPGASGGLLARAASDALDLALMTGATEAKGKTPGSIAGRLAIGALSAVTASTAASL